VGALLSAAAPHMARTAGGCNVKNATLSLPAGQTAISVPTDASPAYIALGVGVQNYTCTAAGTYTSAGALAELFDISCLVGKPSFATIQDSRGLPCLGRHYFITNPANSSTISPEFDLGRSKGPGTAGIIIAKKLGGIPSPVGPTNVDWLELGNQSGGLAKYVFRVDTQGGQPPASCKPGSPLLSVPYKAKYWLFK